MFFPTSDTEVGNRCAPGLDSWYLTSGVKLKLCSHPDTPRTKLVAEAKLCSDRDTMTPPEVKESFSVCTCRGRLLGGQKGKKDYSSGSVVKSTPANAGDTSQSQIQDDPTCQSS